MMKVVVGLGLVAMMGGAEALSSRVAQASSTQSHQMSLNINAPYRSSWPLQQQAFSAALAETFGLSNGTSKVQILRIHPLESERGVQYGTRVDFVVKNVPLSFIAAEEIIDIAKSDGSLLSNLNKRKVHFNQFNPLLFVPGKDPYLLGVSLKIVSNGTGNIMSVTAEDSFKKAICDTLSIPAGAMSSLDAFVSSTGLKLVEIKLNSKYLMGVSPDTLLSALATAVSDGSLVEALQSNKQPVQGVAIMSLDQGGFSSNTNALVPTDEEIAEMMGITTTELRGQREVQKSQAFKVRVGDSRISVKSAGRSTTNIVVV